VTGLRQRQTQEREARILRAAEGLFARRGYAQTSMQDIARRSKLAVGTLYNYFRRKPDILLAILDRDTAEGVSAGEAIVKAPPKDPIAAVERLLERSLAPYARRDRGLWRELMGAAMADREFAQGVFGSDARLIGLLATLLGELEARGDLRPGVDRGRAAIVLYGAFFTWFLAYIASDTLELADAHAELARSIDLIMHGLLDDTRARQGGSP
jgi:AcrR family transcriptional regulator